MCATLTGIWWKFAYMTKYHVKNMTTGAAWFARTLKGYGVTHVFLMESMLRQSMVELEQLGIRRILAHSEKAAAYMADGYARAARRPAVCLCQSVGAANLAAGLQDAWLAGSPVVAVTGRKPLSHQQRNSYQELDHDPLFAPVTKYHAFAADPADVPRHLRQCFREAATGRIRPVHLDITNHTGAIFDMAEQPFDPVVEERFARVPAFRPAPDMGDVRALMELLRVARRPVLVVGAGAALSGAGEQVAALADRHGLPVACSVDGKNLLSDAHPLCMGPVGEYGRSCANALLREADLVVYAGCGVNDQLTLDWTLPGPGAQVAQIDTDPAELGRNWPNAASVCGDARLALSALLDRAGEWKSPEGWTRRAADLCAAWWRERQADFASADVPIHPARLCRELSRILPDEAVVVADTGFSSIWTGVWLRMTRPGQRLIRAAGGSLGWSFPAALGAKCALPDTPVFCFTGDGGFWYHLCEMETAARHNIRTITVLNNNKGFGQCRQKVLTAYRGRPGSPEDLFRFRDVNFCRLAEEMGCLALRVEKPDDLPAAFATALAADLPVLVEVITDMAREPQERE